MCPPETYIEGDRMTLVGQTRRMFHLPQSTENLSWKVAALRLLMIFENGWDLPGMTEVHA